MVLIDTSVWMDHLRRGDAQLAELLVEGAAVVHPWVLGELACGHLRQRDDILGLLRSLPRAATLTEDEFHRFLELHGLAGRGLGFVDVHLLGAARLASLPLWTRDRALARTARALHLAYEP